MVIVTVVSVTGIIALITTNLYEILKRLRANEKNGETESGKLFFVKISVVIFLQVPTTKFI